MDRARLRDIFTRRVPHGLSSREDVEAVLDAMADAATHVPIGWILVPDKATKAIAIAMRDALYAINSPNHQPIFDGEMEQVYSAALSVVHRCPVCSGNDGDAPCAYTTEKPAGCLRAKRLEQNS